MIGIIYRLLIISCIPLSLFAGFWGGIISIAALDAAQKSIAIPAFALGALASTGLTWVISTAIVNFVLLGVSDD